MKNSKSSAAVGAILAASISCAARAGVTWQLVDTGAPKVPVLFSPTGVMDGYTGYILRFSCDAPDTLGSFVFGTGNGAEIVGTFAQRWESFDGTGLSSGYDVPSAGVMSAKNLTPSVWNTDSHFLGDPNFAIFFTSETAQFTNTTITNPFASRNSDFAGYGIGTSLNGAIGLVSAARTTTIDIAYLVVPNGSPFSFIDAEVVTTGLKASSFSYPTPNAHSIWSAAAGSWSDPAKWAPGGGYGQYLGDGSGIPQVRGDSATFKSTGPVSITLDGDRRLSHLTMSNPAGVTILPGTGGALIFDDGSGQPSIDLNSSGTLTITAPIQLAGSLTMAQLYYTPMPVVRILGGVTSIVNTNTDIIIGPHTLAVFASQMNYVGVTTVQGSLQVGDGQTSGNLGDGPVLFPSKRETQSLPGTLTFNRSDTYFVNHPITGRGTIFQEGSGTLVLTDLTGFIGSTVVHHGVLLIEPSAAVPGSNYQEVAPVPTITFQAPAVVWNLRQNQTLAGVGASAGSALNTHADIRAGIASADYNITLRYRTRSAEELSQLYSEVLDITGMTIPASSRTDPFVLQVTYDPQLPNELSLAQRGSLFLGWNDPTGPSDQWLLATDGDFGEGSTVVENFQGSWIQFAAAFSVSDANVGNFLGSWGVDTAGNTTWAVLNHNSQYSVTVPEPASIAVLATGLVLLHRTRKPKRR